MHSPHLYLRRKEPDMADRGSYDIIIAGGGTSGAALAGILARDTSLNILLLEAGPDYGALDDGNWPDDLLDARHIPESHDWGYSGIAHSTHSEPITFERARVIGGCSSHNGCVALGGHRIDYDDWARVGNTGWDWASVAPAFERAKQTLGVRIPDESELAPYQATFIQAAVDAGIPHVTDLNDPDENEGVAPSPANIRDGKRWNTALAYLDPVRSNANLTILGDTLIDRIIVENGRAVAVEGILNGQREIFTAGKIVLSAGAYGSPAILLRSGIGPKDEVARHGIDHIHDLPGVGRGLADHPTAILRYLGSDDLNAQMAAFEQQNWLPDEQSLLKARSSRCSEAFDLHLYPTTWFDPELDAWRYYVYVSSVLPKSVGTLTLASADPETAPIMEHGFLTDVDGEDRAVLADGVKLGRRIMQPLLDSGMLSSEQAPGAEISNDQALLDWIDRTVDIYYHPACSCRMGPDTDASAVVGPDGKVHGLENLYVCDASIFPVLMRANTNLPAAMVAEHLATRLAR
jgi:choline dehydrogenase